MTNIKLTKIAQHFPRPRVEDIASAVRDTLEPMHSTISSGDSIAIACGSRGIANIALIAKTTVEVLKSWGAEPFIIPAMGSHGGGTAEGQREVLEGYGITEDYVGVPIRATMDTAQIPAPELQHKVYMDRYAWESDGVVLINRIKAHTDFHGPHESGLVKMSVIGLGKHTQALEIHKYGVYGLRELIPVTSKCLLQTGKIRFGIALVENAYDETQHIQAFATSDIMEGDAALLPVSKASMPTLPVENLDVLIIDEMGKNISGSGIDPNIIGRLMIRGEEEPDCPNVHAITIHSLTEASHGNACGIGLADVTTRHLFGQIDLDVTNANIVTSSFYERGKIPVIADSDQQAFEWALRTCGPIPPEKLRVVRIKNTLHLSEVYVSDAILAEMQQADVTFDVSGKAAAQFDESGKLVPF